MPKLLLINPAPEKDISLATSLPFMRVPPLGLGYLAALTPPDWDIKIIDENIKRYKNEQADLVALTSVTYNAPRAYELASHFRKRDIKTVMGGVHASMLADEALQYTDSVVIGEAESVWLQLIRDFENNKLQKKYNGTRGPLENLPHPRRDLYPGKYIMKNIQTARGCPMRCDFCSVSAFNGGNYRERPVDDVLDELENIGSGHIFIIDDNIIGHGKKAEDRAIALFKGIRERKLNIRWGGQASINIAGNKQVLKCAQESGCHALFIGFESLSEDSLKSMNKQRNLSSGVKNYKTEIKTLQDYGIGVLGGFIFGSDNDNKDIFKRTADFIFDSEIDGSQLSILTPLPGTRLYHRLKEENRLLYTDYPKDWIHYDISDIVFRPKNMTPDELINGILDIYKSTASTSASLKRAFRTIIQTRSIYNGVAAYSCNHGYSSIFFRKYSNSRR